MYYLFNKLKFFNMKKFIVLLAILALTGCEMMGIKGISGRKGLHSETTEKIDGKEAKKLFVGLLIPLSGKYESIGNMLLKSAQLSMFNNKNNNIILIPYDTKGNSFGAVEAMNNAVRDGVEIVIGPLFTESTKAVLEIADINNLIVISLSDNQSILDSKNATKLYLMGLTPKQEIHRVVSYLIDKQDFYGFSGMFLNDSYGNSSLNAFKEVIFRKDAKIIKTEFYSKNDVALERKVNSLLNNFAIKDEVYQKYEGEKALARSEGLTTEIGFVYEEEDKIYADALLIPSNDVNLLTIGEVVKSSRSRHIPLLIGGNRWLNNSLFTNPDFNGAIFAAPNPNNYNKFEEMFLQAYGQNPPRAASLSYDAVTAVAEAFAKAKTVENLQREIENQRGFAGINGKFRFIHDGTLERKLAIIKITNGKFEIIDYDSNDFLNY